VAERLKSEEVLVAPLGANVIRAVTHLDVNRSHCQKAAEAIRRLAG
jgi:threonine aldolase